MTRYAVVTSILAGAALIQIGCDQSGASDKGGSSKTSTAKVSDTSPSSAAGKKSTADSGTQTAPGKSMTGPAWHCDEVSFNFVELWAGPQASMSHTFTFRNIGTETLKILDTKAKCGCTVAEAYSTEVSPGGTGQLPLKLNARNLKAGWVSKTVDVMTNDPRNPKVVLELKGNIKNLCSFTPHLGTIFSQVKSDDRLYREVTVRSNVDYPLQLEMHPIPANSFFQINWEEVVPGKEWRYTALAEPPLPEGRSGSTLMVFNTNCPEVPRYEIYASCYVLPRVQIIPQKLVLQKVEPVDKTRDIRIVNNGKTPYELVSIMTSDPRLNPILMPQDPLKPNEYKIQCSIPAGYEPPAYGELIEIKTTDYEKGVIIVPVLTMAAYKNPAVRPADKPLEWVPGDMSAATNR